mgnify:CR=1 FL=1
MSRIAESTVRRLSQYLRFLREAQAVWPWVRPYLDDRQIESSRTIMGLDTQLVEDGTYFVVESAGRIVGCGGWSRRRTLFGGDQAKGTSDPLLDPATDPANRTAAEIESGDVRRVRLSEVSY